MHVGEDWKPVGLRQQIKIGSIMSKGSSNVYKGIFENIPVAVKSMLCDEETTKIYKEIVAKLKHPNIIQILYRDWDRTTLFIAMELCQYNLRQYVDKADVNKEIGLTRVQVLQQITEGLHYLHGGKTHYTIHRDLKPSNVLFKYVDRDRIWMVKISDFGISKDVKYGITSTSADVVGSSGFIAPELIPLPDGSPGPGKIRKAIDIFSLGVIFYIVLSSAGSHPFSKDVTDVNKRVRDSDPDLSDLRDEFKATKVKQLILSMLKKDYIERPDISGVRSHLIFWDDGKKLDFICDVSDLLEDRQKQRSLLITLEERKTKVFCDNWKDAIIEGKPAVKETLERRGEKDKKSLQALIRQIRNWREHFTRGRKEFRDQIGDPPSKFLAFFTNRFPKLISFLYEFMRSFDDARFQKLYYGCSAKEVSNGIPNTSSATGMNDIVNQSDIIDEQFPDVGLNIEFTYESLPTDLALQAINGKNSLIITTSDSETADLCWEIIISHLQQPESRSIISLVLDDATARKQSRILRQQLCKEIKPVYDIVSLTNDFVSDLPIGLVIKKMKVVVLTPEILVYALTKESPYLSFHDVSMMVFDECYNTMDEMIQHSYKSILDAMLRFQITNPLSQSIQLVGITSCCDLGSSTVETANLLELMAALNVTSVSSHPSLSLPEMITKNNLTIVDSVTDEVTTKLLEIIHILETKLKERGIFGRSNSLVQPPPDQKALVKYKGWIYEVANSEATCGSMTQEVATTVRSLEISHDLLNLKNVIPIPLKAFKKVNEFAPDLYGALKQISSTEVALIKKLYEILDKQFTNDNSRDRYCLIIVENNLIGQAIYDELKTNWELPEFNRHVAIRGRQNSNSYFFNTGNDEHETGFWIGIATITEEGWDVPHCDLIILYEFTEAISTLTRHGGAGRVQIECLISHEENLKTKHLSELFAKFAIRNLTSLAVQSRISKIEDVRTKRRRKMVDQISKELLDRKEATGWKILCVSCHGYLTQACKIQRLNNVRHVVDENFENIVCCVLSPANQIETELICNEDCQKRIGSKKKIEDNFYLILDLHAVIFQNDEGETLSFRQWDECPFPGCRENISDQMQIDVSNKEQIDELLTSFRLSQEQLIDPTPASEVLSDILIQLADQASIYQSYRHIYNAVVAGVRELAIHLFEFL